MKRSEKRPMNQAASAAPGQGGPGRGAQPGAGAAGKRAAQAPGGRLTGVEPTPTAKHRPGAARAEATGAAGAEQGAWPLGGRDAGRGTDTAAWGGSAAPENTQAAQAGPADSVWARAQGGEPAAHLAALHSAADSLGLALSAQVFERLQAYQALLLRWNKVYNLSAIRDADRMRVQHLVDCLAVLPALQRWLGPTATPPASAPSPSQPVMSRRLLDVGSGGGLPGVVLAIARPDWAVDCVDTVAKKASFIRQVSAELGLTNLRGLHSRVEALAAPAALPRGARSADIAAGDAGHGPAATASAAQDPAQSHTAPAAGYHLVTSRAFASLPDFTRLTAHLLRPDGVWAAMKGRVPEDEMAQLSAVAGVFHVEQLQVPGLDAERCLIWMRPPASR